MKQKAAYTESELAKGLVVQASSNPSYSGRFQVQGESRKERMEEGGWGSIWGDECACLRVCVRP